MNIGPFQVTYCTNVHPGESVDAVVATLDHAVPAVKSLVAPSASFGAGLRLGHGPVAELKRTPTHLQSLQDALSRHDLNVFTVNGFPYGEFGSGVVKETVYEPNWTQGLRVNYTLDLARIVSTLPGPSKRTISTVAGGYRPDTTDSTTRHQIATNLLKVAEGLEDLFNATGVHIRLCLEPEPWTTLETTDDVLHFFDRYLPPDDPRVKGFLGICYDCCHQAVHFEDAASSLTAMHEAGINIGKIQVSSALHLATPSNPEARHALLAFAEPRFLHQVVAHFPTGIESLLDLNEVENPPSHWFDATAWRCHFHVPIDWDGDDYLQTTRRDWEAAIDTIQTLNITPHLEIETYTWHVLPAALRPKSEGDLARAIGREFAALTHALQPDES